MIQNQINCFSDTKLLRMKCYLCKELDHIINNCPLLHLTSDKEKIIKSNEYSNDQNRIKLYRTQKKTKFKIFKPKKNIFDYSSLKSDFDSLDSIDLSILLEEKSRKNIKSDEFPSKTNQIWTSNQTILENRRGSELMSEEENIVLNREKQKIIVVRNENNGEIDKIHEFKNFYPAFNFSNLLKHYEFFNFSSKKMATKSLLFKKYSQYTFNLWGFYQKMKKKNNSKKKDIAGVEAPRISKSKSGRLSLHHIKKMAVQKQKGDHLKKNENICKKLKNIFGKIFPENL